jgi:hypothetical protein
MIGAAPVNNSTTAADVRRISSFLRRMSFRKLGTNRLPARFLDTQESTMSANRTKPLHKTDTVAAKVARSDRREKLVDDALERSFPASDPPSYMGGSTTGGSKKGSFTSEDEFKQEKRKLREETNRH